MIKKTVLAVFVAAICSGIVLAATGYRALYCKPGDCPTCPAGPWAISTGLPSPAITSDGALLDAIPGATAVLKFDPPTGNLYKFSRPGGTPTCTTVAQTGMLGAGTPSAGDGGAPCADLQGEGCFCINPAAGAGYFAIMSIPGSFQIVGDPAAATTTLEGPSGSNPTGLNLWSLPNCPTNLNTASALMGDIGLPSVAHVLKYIAATDSFEVYTGRKGSPSTDFALQQSTAYYVKMNSTVVYTPTLLPGCSSVSNVCPGGQRNFGVAGTADTTAYAWEVKTGATSLCHNYVAPLSIGDANTVIAGKIVTDIVNKCDPTKLTAFTDTSASFFDVTAMGTTTPPLKLFLGNGPGAPACQVMFGAPCTFNPTVYDRASGLGNSVPAMTQWALLHLVLFMLAAGTLLLQGPVGVHRTFVQPSVLWRTLAASFALALAGLALATWWIDDPLPSRDWLGAGISALLAGYTAHLWLSSLRAGRATGASRRTGPG